VSLWERVAVSGHNLWFQRGFHGRVHQVALDNIRDLSIDETAARGFTLRHGRNNRLVRLQVRMHDKRVIALPKTDPDTGLDAVEAVANHLRMRLQQLRDRDLAQTKRIARTAERPSIPEADAADAPDEDLRRALSRLRQGPAPKRSAH
jgi:hypothetical protein